MNSIEAAQKKAIAERFDNLTLEEYTNINQYIDELVTRLRRADKVIKIAKESISQLEEMRWSVVSSAVCRDALTLIEEFERSPD